MAPPQGGAVVRQLDLGSSGDQNCGLFRSNVAAMSYYLSAGDENGTHSTTTFSSKTVIENSDVDDEKCVVSEAVDTRTAVS